MLPVQKLIERREKHSLELPSFGIKDFEPDGSSKQSYEINGFLGEIKQLISHERVKMLGSLSQAVWDPELSLAKVMHQTGSHWVSIGHTVNQELYIYPEEALYLLEIGALEISYNGVSLSVQRAYSLLLGPKTDITIEKYRVYSHLNIHGLKVMRHSPLNTVTKYEKQLEVHKLHLKLKKFNFNIDREKRSLEVCNKNSEKNKKLKSNEHDIFPLNLDGEHNIPKICEKMQLIQPYENNKNTTLKFDYDLYLEPSSKGTFKKSCFQLPSFRLIIHRNGDLMPNLQEICRLSSVFNDSVPVIQAVVFPDYISFYEINPVVLPKSF